MGAEDSHQGIDGFAIWFIRNEARALVGRFGFGEDDREDIQQELKLDLLKHLPGYDSRRAKQSTFTKMVVEQKVIGLIETKMAKKRGCGLCTCSLNEEIEDGEGGSTERIETIATDAWLRATGRQGLSSEEHADLRLDLGRFEALLSPGFRWLFESLKTKTLAEISRETGIPRSTLNDRREKLRGMLEDSRLKDYL